ncbi:MAG: hypothetical protein ABI136_02505 [Ginsengibacter sp.]
MIFQSINLLEKLTSSEIKNLTLVVKETVAKDFKKERKRIFSAAELWDIQRRKRNFSIKRIMF